MLFFTFLLYNLFGDNVNDEIIKQISNDLNLNINNVSNVLSLLEKGNTIPFIARYRKELTGNMDEDNIKKINDVYIYQINLLKRKEDVIRLIEEKGLLTDDIKNKILSCNKLVDIEDIYFPYKERKKTKATEAIANGLEGLAKMILSFPTSGNLYDMVNNYKCKLSSYEDKLSGAGFIIAEYISLNGYYRKYIRNYLYKNSTITSSKKKNSIDDELVYEMYYSYSESVSKIKPHRILALNRGEKENVLNVNIDNLNEDIISYLNDKIIKNKSSFVCSFVKECIQDSYKRLIFPSIEREIRSNLTDKASSIAIDNFSNNLRNLLMTPSMKEINVLGFDPAFRTGCKLAVLDKTGKLLDIGVIYPHEPKCLYEESKKILLDLINKYNIDVIAIGNGTASRESEAFVVDTLKSSNSNCKYIIVNEAGASVYSASSIAKEEFPTLDVSERSAISIGRRLQDPLSELVKIDPKSIGVGLYQHDVKQKELNEALNYTVSSVVNSVGVNANTCSYSILSYVSGLNKKSITSFLEQRDKIGKFNNRTDIKKIKGISDKTYEQAIGFIRINDGDNPLDKTNIHPESYDIVYKLLDKLGLNILDIGSDSFNNTLDNIVFDDIDFVDKYTLIDIINNLKKPLLDPRDELIKPILRSDILKLEDLCIGMKLQGTVRNVIDFGCFVDIGLKNDALIHISNMSDSYIKHPSDIVNVGDIIDCYVLDVNKNKNKVSLTLKDEWKNV